MSPNAPFAAGLLQPMRPAPSAIHAASDLIREHRYAVHRNNVTHALVAAFERAYPVVRALLGAGCFAQLARDCARAQPPRTPVLSEYVAVLPAFLDGAALAAEYPYLPEVASLEADCLRVYHAAEVEPLPAAAWRGLLDDPSRLASTAVQLGPACAWRRCRYPAAAVWLAHTRAERHALADVTGIDLDRAEDALAWRDRDGLVRVAAMPTGSASAFDALAAGVPLLPALAVLGPATCAGVLEQLAAADMVIALLPYPPREGHP